MYNDDDGCDEKENSELGQNITHFHIIMLGNMSVVYIAMRNGKLKSYDDKSCIKQMR